MADIKLLIIEDDLFYQTYVNDLLKGARIDVVNASDGEQGLELARSERPDIILTDIEIPKIQGFVLLRHLKEGPETSHIPVIMMSGKVEKDLLERHARLTVAAEGYLLKPFSRQELLDMIDRVVSGERVLEIDSPTAERASVTAGPALEVPSVIETEPSEESFPPQHVVSRLKPMVLVVDDSPYVCDLTRDHLEEAGFMVRVAMDGDQGLNLVREERPDIVLLDVQMPKMDGFRVCENIKRDDRTRKIPVILMSAVVDERSFERHSRLEYHADAYIQKPFKKREILDLIYEHLPAVALHGAVESKMDFFVPDEGDLISAKEWSPIHESVSGSEGPGIFGASDEVPERSESEEQLARQIQALQEDYEQFREKAEEASSRSADEREQLREKLTLATRRAETAGDALKAVQGEAEKLRMNLEAALAAKREIEDQASRMAESVRTGSVDGDPGGELSRLRKENIELTARLADADASFRRAEDMEDLLARTQTENRQLRESLAFSEGGSGGRSGITDLKRELEESRTLLAESEKRALEVEVEARKARDLANRLTDDLQAQGENMRISLGEMERLRADLKIMEADASAKNRRMAVLQSELENLKTAEALESGTRRKLEERLLTLQSERGAQERELNALRLAAAETDELKARVGVLNKEKDLLQERLRESVALREDAESRSAAYAREDELSSRLDQIEGVLKRTVTEAQQTFQDQRAREEDLQERLKEVVGSLEAERNEHQRERDTWQAREQDLRGMVEDFLDERRRMMGDEIAQMFPVHVRRNAPAYEVISGKRKLGNIALAILLLVLVFFLGYLTLSRIESRSVRTSKISINSLPPAGSQMEARQGEPHPGFSILTNTRDDTPVLTCSPNLPPGQPAVPSTA